MVPACRPCAKVALGLILGCALAPLGCGPGDPVADAGATPIVPPPARCGAPPPEVACAVDVGGTLPLRVFGTTRGGEDGYGGARCGLGGDTIEDVAFRWTAPRTDAFRISTQGTAFDSFLSIRDGSCAGREIACEDEGADGAPQAQLELPLAECRTVTIVIDGRGVDDVGEFVLTIHGSEASCDDGVDDDGDGAADCEDSDCFGPACRGPDEWPVDWADLEWRVVELVNARRAAGASCGGVPHGPAPPLEMDVPLRLAARLHSQDMSEQGYFSHESLDGRMLGDRVAEAEFRGAGPLGENIIMGTADAGAAVEGWMSSPGHCENIMNPAFHVTGVGYASERGGSRMTQVFGGSH